ncbi:hypothetical protein [Streptomyces canus]|uniref:hypothetical protein n=1 Tax=Streptomyces canus TaxID=58343 RepID=UPI003CF38ED4
MPHPTPGRVVMYRLTEDDARHITQHRTRNELRGNFVREGDRYPAMIVRAFPGNPADAVNLQVLLDVEDTHWVTSARLGEEPGTWAWPERV